MKWTYEWLREYLDTDYSAEQICETLNRTGLEVEDFVSPTPPIAAKIVECRPHENSDHLHVLMVDDGSGKLRQVVCGAPNVRVGMVSALARPGCIIDGHKIEVGKLRGVVSNGMMCSEQELGIGSDDDGIMELDSDTNPGTPIAGVYASEIFDTGITPNRPDYLAVRGIALDLAACGVGRYIAKAPKILAEKPGARGVQIMSDRCPTYRMAEIHGIKNAPSSDKIARRLSAAGINPKNACVDATNYICYDMSQPLHCFDADKVDGPIIVRTAQNGEKFTDLFGATHELTDKDLVIADMSGILALAGIIGGARAMTTDDTKNIILESAYFEPVGIRKTAKRLGLSTDASYRYERGIDPNVSGPALAAAAEIIMDACGGEIVSVVNAGRTEFTPNKIAYNPAFCLQRTGVDMPISTQREILESLQFNVSDGKGGIWTVTPRSARVDMMAPENIVSDLIRIYGYDRVGLSGVVETKSENADKIESRGCVGLKRRLANMGLNENISFGFGNSKIDSMLTDKPIIPVSNPITVEFDCMRNNLLGNLLIALTGNIKRGYPNVAMFELGTVFDGDMPGDEHTQICIVRSGATSPKHWMKRNRTVDVFDVKSDILSLIGNQKYTIDTTDAPKWAHPYKYGRITQGPKRIAEFGELHPNIAHALHIKSPTVIAIIDDIKNLPDAPKHAKTPITEFQPITRDFAFVTDAKFPAEKLVATARGADNRIGDVMIFDSFDMGGGNKSVAFTITIYPTSNMGDAELTELQNKVITAVTTKCHATLRA
ncbi:MAG: phenylalanine--tRNA ligase subunit beta [Alphaproteobacteria bacterium]